MRSLEELQARRVFCRYCIQTISAVDDSDPRKPGALVEYNRQLASIDAEIAAITGEIPPIVIGLKPARLVMKSEGVGQ